MSKTIFAPEKIELSGKSIFLAGPTPRLPEVKSWRPEALNLFDKLNFDGIVLVPERRDWIKGFDYINQVEWEWEGLENCSTILFWIPRELITMPAFTTNVEFGSYVRSGRAYYGRPDWSEKNSYLDWLYTKVTGRQPKNNLEGLIKEVI